LKIPVARESVGRLCPNPRLKYGVHCIETDKILGAATTHYLSAIPPDDPTSHVRDTCDVNAAVYLLESTYLEIRDKLKTNIVD